jgi:hypothetical protein
MMDSMRRFLVENGIDPENPEVKRAAEGLEADFPERMARTQQVLRGGRCVQTCDDTKHPERSLQCVLDASHQGPHKWGMP